MFASPLSNPWQAQEAEFLYHQIVDECEAAGLFVPTAASTTSRPKVYLHDLFRALHRFCPTDSGRVNLVCMILHGLFSSSSVTTPSDRSLDTILPLARAWHRAARTDPDRQHVYRTLSTIAADFLTGFFVPLTAQASCTPSVSTVFTPPSASDVSSSQGTPHRLHVLRHLCLLRDGHRCVVSGLMDKEFHTQERCAGRHHVGYATATEAAHIIPHSLNAVTAINDPLSKTKSFVWQILNMFEAGVSLSLEGPRIDSPANAMILEHNIHDEFGKLRCYFEEVGENTYRVVKTRDAAVLMPLFAPKGDTITFINCEPAGVRHAELPSPRLLKLHAACAKMMEMAGAAEYVESVLYDLEKMEEEGTLMGDGSSDIGIVLRMRGLLGGEEVVV